MRNSGNSDIAGSAARRAPARGTLIAVLVLTMWCCGGAARVGAVPGRGTTAAEVDFIGAVNPEGLLLTGEVFRRWTTPGGDAGLPSPYFQAGVGAGSSPAYGKASLHAEWMPHPALQLRAQYTLSRFYGTSGALLSFPSGDAAFGKEEVDALAETEEAGWGQRLLLRPILRLALGPLLLRNVTDFAYCRFDGSGPYFLDWEYGTLVADRSWIFSDSLQIFGKLWQGPGAAALYAGPYFEITHAESAGLAQARTGLAAAWTLRDRIGGLRRPRVYAQAGMHLRDPNREDELYVVVGAGFELE
jgi:hypothetical protein